MIRRAFCLMLALLPLSLTAPALALDVWVSASSGDDNAAGSEQAPFATLERALGEDSVDAQLVVHLLPGTYRQFVLTQRAGTHIVVAEADRGAVVLSGSEPSSSLAWTHADPPGLPAAAAGQVWWADLSSWEIPPQIVTSASGAEVTRLLAAREPDWAVTTEWKWHEHWETAGMAPLRYASDEDPNSGLSAHFLSSAFLVNQWGDLTGARIWAKDTHSGHDTYAAGILQHWFVEGTVELSRACEISSGEDGLGEHTKFYVEGAASLLDQEGEWFFDASSGRIYLWPPGGGDPATLDIEIARREQGISVEHGDFLVDGVVFRGFNYQHDYWNTRASGLFVHTQSDATLAGVTVRHCLFEHAGRGIHAVASSAGGIVTLDGMLVEDTRIAHIDGHGINIQSWPNDTIGPRNITVQRCDIEDVGFRNPEPTDSAGSVSFSRVGDLRFLDNEVAYTPHNSVQINYGCENVLVKGNHVHHCGLNAADNGCIKFWNNIDHFDAGTPRSILVTENLIHDSMGWAYSSEANEWWQTTGLSGSGVYCDYYRGVTFYRNIIHTVGNVALWPNTPSNLNWMINNTVLQARHGASCSRSTPTTADQGEALVTNNLFMGFTTWGFPEDYYWGQLESGVLYSRTDELLESHHNGFFDVLHDMLYVDASNNGNKYDTVADVWANSSYEQGSIDLSGPATAIVVDSTTFDVHPVSGSQVIDVGAELPAEMAAIFERVGLSLDAPQGSAYDIGAIEGAGGPWLRVGYPNGGEILPTGGEVTITWESAAFVGPVSIELATQYAAAPQWQTLAAITSNDGSELVTLPAVYDDSCRVRIREVADGDPLDESDADFEIGDAILVTAPAEGDELVVGASFVIRWSSGGVIDVDIDLSRDGGATYEAIATGVPAADGSFAWTVNGPASGNCLVRISDAADDDPVGLSAEFAIHAAAPGAGAGEDEGCGCRLVGDEPSRSRSEIIGLLGVLLVLRRRSARR